MKKAKKLLTFIPAAVYYAAGFYLSSKNLHLQAGFRHFDKIFHTIEFCGFGVLLAMGFFKTLKTSTAARAIVACTVGFVFSALDEFHQYFVPGRSSDVPDFLADAAGIVLGVMLYVFFVRKIKRRSIHPPSLSDSPQFRSD